MAFLDVICVIIIAPVCILGGLYEMFLLFALFHLLTRQCAFDEFKASFKEMRLSKEFINSTKKFFWFTYTPLFALTILFRSNIPLAEKYEGIVFAGIIGYILVVLFSGYATKNK